MTNKPLSFGKYRFFSLKWRIIILFSLGIVVINLVFFYFDYTNLIEYAEGQRKQIHKREKQELAGLLQREAFELQKVGELLPSLPGIREALADADAPALKKGFDGFWQTLELDMDIEMINFYSSGGEFLAGWSSLFLTDNFPELNAQLVARVKHSEHPASTVVCYTSCAQYVLIPVLVQGKNKGTILLGSSFGNLLRSLQEISGNDVGLMLGQTVVADDEHTLPQWNVRVAAITNPKRNLPLLKKLAQEYKNPPGPDARLDIKSQADTTYEFKFLPLTNIDGKIVAHLIIVSDITPQVLVIQAATTMGVVLLIAGLLFSELALMAMLWKPMSRLRSTATSLPLLAKRQYERLRRVAEVKPGTLLLDEVDILNKSAVRLSYELESLETALHKQTRELAAKVAELARERERYELAARGANDGLWDWNLETGRIYFSPRWKHMSGYDDDAIGDFPEEWFSRVHPEDITALRQRVESHLAGLTPHIECEYRLLQSDDSYRWMLTRALAVWNADHHPIRVAGSQTDIHLRKEVERQLQHDALHDALTHLPNRLLFLDRLRQAMNLSKRKQGHLFAVAYVDLDRFKIVNDSLGHTVGDELLKAVARRFTQSLRPFDTVARMGGDEFALILDDLESREQIVEIIRRIMGFVTGPVMLEGREVFTTLSIGITFYAARYENPDEMLRDADTAMYHAKKNGKNRYSIFDTSMRVHVLTLMKVQEELKRGIERDELVLHYQPVIRLSDGKAVGFEALVRWNHVERGVLLPGEFLPIAEETELMAQLGDWVIGSVCKQIKAWEGQLGKRSQVPININLDARHLMQPGFPDEMLAVVKRYGVSTQQIKIEITENILLENVDIAVVILEQLKDYGFKMCLDDFGTGYSSLSYLNRLPIDTVKIDRSFVVVLDGPKADNAIVRAIITLAHSLGADVVAEGIETEAQLQELKELGCDYGQGFLFAKGLAADKVEGYLARMGE